MGKGSNTTSTSSSNFSSADPQAAQLYRDILQRAQGVAATPYQAYTGQLSAPTNAQQNLGVAGVNSASGYADPYLQQASQQAGASSAPITAQTIQQYQNPYTQQVVDATTAQMRNEFGQQHAGLTSNAIAQGALGGNAVGVGRGILSGQQGRTMASTVAGLYDNSYKQALAAAQAQQQTGLQGANAQANYGISGQNAALQTGVAQYGVGQQQQTAEQAALDRQYQQYAQAQAFPYQQTQWLAGLGTGVGSNLGGYSNSSGTQTGPQPNQTAQWLGLGLSAAGMLSDRNAKEDIERVGALNDGTPIYRFRYKGDDQWHIGPMAQDVEKRNPDAVSRGVDGMRYVDMHEAAEGSVERASGGGVVAPWSDIGQGWIPSIGIAAGSGAPRGGSGSGGGGGGDRQPAFDPQKLAGGLQGAVKGVQGLFASPADYGQHSNIDVGGYSMPQFGNTIGVGGYQMPTIGFAAGGGVSGIQEWLQPQGMFGEDAPPNFNERFSGQPRVMDSPGTPVAEMGEGMDPEALTGVAGVDNPVRLHGSTFGPEQPQGAPVVAEDEEAAPAPTGVAGRAGGAPMGGVMAFGPEGEEGSYSQMPDAIRRPADERAGLGFLPISKNAGTGLLAAGLGMMASRSPFLGTAVGEGGLTGVAAYGGAEERDRKIAAEAAKLSQEARKTAFDQTHRTNTLAETSRHNRASEDQTRKQNYKPTWGDVDEDPITGRKIKGWIDPNRMTTTVPGSGKSDGAVAAGPTKSEGIPPHLSGPAYMEELEKRNPEFARTVKAVGDYRASITSLSMRGGLREKILEAANRYNPEYDQTQYAGKSRAVTAFAAGPEGRAVRSLNVSIDHLDTLREAADAMKNGNIPLLNKIVNYAREKTGSPLTTNFDSIKQVVSAEIAKAVVGGQTALHDRDDMAKRAANSQSPDQLNGIIAQFQKLMAGQMKGLRRAYETTTKMKNFDDYMEPRTRKIMSEMSHHADEGSAGGVTAKGGSMPEGRTGMKNGRPVVVKGGKLIYSDTGEPAQ